MLGARKRRGQDWGAHGLHVPKRSTERTTSQGRSACLAWNLCLSMPGTASCVGQTYDVDQETHVPVRQRYNDLFLLEGVKPTGDIRPTWVAFSAQQPIISSMRTV